MTDNEIIKEATEAYEQNLSASAYIGDLLRIIKERGAEIERLQKHSKEVAENCTFVMRENDKANNKRFLEAIEVVKCRAIKEFAERLKEIKANLETLRMPLLNMDIDNLVKEMTEQKEEIKK